jgi:formylmethanofuran dehydrogenase subunit C
MGVFRHRHQYEVRRRDRRRFFLSAGAPTNGTFRWYTDATPDGSMSGLAAENTAPTLTGAQTMGGIVRLRVQLTTTVTALHMEYSVDGTNWADVPNADNSGVSNAENRWFTWANGAATAGGTIGTQLLTGTQASGTYIEARGQTATVSGGNRTEFDLAFKVRWPPPETTILIRLLDGASPITLPQTISLTTCAVADRLHTIDKADTNASGGQNREVNHGAWPRIFHDGTYWWMYTVQPATSTSTVVYYRSSDLASWTKFTVAGGAGTISTTAETDVKHTPWMRTISGTPVAGVGLFPSSGNMRYLRGYVSAGAITWASPVDIGAARPGSQSHSCIDQGGFHWIAGINGTTGVWARRSTSADDGSTGYVPAFGSQLSLTDSGVAAGNILALVPLASNKVLAIWRNGTALKSAEVTGSGWGSASTATATAAINIDDWGATLAGDGFVYLLHTDNAGTGGTWKTRKYDVGTPGWSAGTDPGAAQPTQNSNADGLVVTASGATDVYAFGTTVGTDGGQDRTITAIKWNGSAWSNEGVVTPAGGRGNGDDIAGPPIAAAGAIPIVYLFNDNDVNGFPYTYEVHVLTVAEEVPLGDINVNPQTVTGGASGAVPQGTLTVAGQVPTVGTTLPQGSITLTGRTPTGSGRDTAAAGSLTIAGSAPGSASTSLPAGSITVAGQVPAPATGLPVGARTVTGQTPTGGGTGAVPVGSIVLNGQAPSEPGAPDVVPKGVITIAGQAPTGTTSDTAAKGSITTTGQTTPSAATALPSGTITLTGQVPAASTSLPVGSIVISGKTPSEPGAPDVVPTGTITVTGRTPTGTTAGTANKGALTITGQSPTGGGASLPVGGLVLTGRQPSGTTGDIVPKGSITIGGQIPGGGEFVIIVAPYVDADINQATVDGELSEAETSGELSLAGVSGTIRR